MFQTKVDKILAWIEKEGETRKKLDTVFSYICSLHEETQRKNGVVVAFVDAPAIHRDTLPFDNFAELKLFDVNLGRVNSMLSNYVSIYPHGQLWTLFFTMFENV